MMKAMPAVVLPVLLVAAVGVPVAAQSGQAWSFEGVDRIEIDGTSGNLEVVAGSGSAVALRLEQHVSPADAFRSEVQQSGSTLRIAERWGGGSSRGSVRWILTIPASLRPSVEMDTASGGVVVSGVTARFEIDTASGDFELRGGTLLAGSNIDTASGDLRLVECTVEDDVEMSTASGDVELDGVVAGRDLEFSTASGDVRVRRSRGVLEGSSASGDVVVEDSELDGPGSFSSASGDVTVRLSSAPSHDLEASSASGDVELMAASLGASFTLVMTVRQDRGRIESPFSDASEETFERHGRTYLRQTVRHGSGGPEIRLDTASGRIVVRERS